MCERSGEMTVGTPTQIRMRWMPEVLGGLDETTSFDPEEFAEKARGIVLGSTEFLIDGWDYFATNRDTDPEFWHMINTVYETMVAARVSDDPDGRKPDFLWAMIMRAASADYDRSRDPMIIEGLFRHYIHAKGVPELPNRGNLEMALQLPPDNRVNALRHYRTANLDSLDMSIEKLGDPGWLFRGRPDMGSDMSVSEDTKEGSGEGKMIKGLFARLDLGEGYDEPHQKSSERVTSYVGTMSRLLRGELTDAERAGVSAYLPSLPELDLEELPTVGDDVQHRLAVAVGAYAALARYAQLGMQINNAVERRFKGPGLPFDTRNGGEDAYQRLAKFYRRLGGRYDAEVGLAQELVRTYAKDPTMAALIFAGIAAARDRELKVIARSMNPHLPTDLKYTTGN